MNERKRPIKRTSKHSTKQLNIKDTKKPRAKRKTSKQTSAHTKLSLEKFQEFRVKGLTLLKGKAGDKKTMMVRYASIAVAVLIIIGIVTAFALSPTGIVENIKYKYTLSKTGSGFPIESEIGTAKSLDYSNGCLLVTNESEIRCFNNNGAQIYSRIHGFTNPVVKTSKIRTLTYGINATRYIIHTPQEEVINKSTSDGYGIITADISNSGVYAIATTGSQEVSLVTVYDKDAKEIYKFHSSNNHVLNVSVSENGKRMCVVTVTTRQAHIVSKISIFDFDSVEPIFEQELNDEVVYVAEYMSSNALSIVTNKSYICIKGKKIHNKIDYEANSLNKYEINHDSIVLYNKPDDNSLSGTVRVLNANGKNKAEFEIQGNISDISCYKNKVYTLDENVCCYNFSGEKLEKIEINNGASDIQAFPRGVAVLYSSGIDLVK